MVWGEIAITKAQMPVRQASAAQVAGSAPVTAVAMHRAQTKAIDRAHTRSMDIAGTIAFLFSGITDPMRPLLSSRGS